jgi:hypothetical protein
MNDKKAVKKFMSNKKSKTSGRRVLYETIDSNERCKETIDSIYDRL